MTSDGILIVPANVAGEIDYPTKIDPNVKLTQLSPSERIQALHVFLERCVSMLKKIKGPMTRPEEDYIRQSIASFIVKRDAVKKMVLSKAVKDEEGKDIYDIALIKQGAFKRIDIHRMFTLTLVDGKGTT